MGLQHISHINMFSTFLHQISKILGLSSVEPGKAFDYGALVSSKQITELFGGFFCILPLADPGFGQGGPRKMQPKCCRRSGVESCERSKPQLARV